MRKQTIIIESQWGKRFSAPARRAYEKAGFHARMDKTVYYMKLD